MNKRDKESLKRYFEAHQLAEELKAAARGEQKFTAEECPLMDKMVRENRFGKTFVDRMTDSDYVAQACTEIELERHAKDRNIKLLLHKVQRHNTHRKLWRVSSVVGAAAAVVILCLMIWNNGAREKRELIMAQKSNIFLNSDVPTLVLDNGECVKLTDANVKAENFSVNEQGVLQYRKSDSARLNKLIIPCRNTYTVILEDGTEVHLNASSELIYPSVFVGKVREVELRGEAYFKVAKSKIPFVVKTKDLKVKVYGTEFNLNTNKQNCTETILVEGSVGVTASEREIMMKPRQLFKYNASSMKADLSNVNPNNYLAWRSGYMTYDMAPVGDVLDDISAWYGVKFICKDGVKSKKIGLSVNRNRNIAELLLAIEEMIGVKFIEEGGNVYTVES